MHLHPHYSPNAAFDRTIFIALHYLETQHSTIRTCISFSSAAFYRIIAFHRICISGDATRHHTHLHLLFPALLSIA